VRGRMVGVRVRCDGGGLGVGEASQNPTKCNLNIYTHTYITYKFLFLSGLLFIIYHMDAHNQI